MAPPIPWSHRGGVLPFSGVDKGIGYDHGYKRLVVYYIIIACYIPKPHSRKVGCSCYACWRDSDSVLSPLSLKGDTTLAQPGGGRFQLRYHGSLKRGTKARKLECRARESHGRVSSRRCSGTIDFPVATARATDIAARWRDCEELGGEVLFRQGVLRRG